VGIVNELPACRSFSASFRQRLTVFFILPGQQPNGQIYLLIFIKPILTSVYPSLISMNLDSDWRMSSAEGSHGFVHLQPNNLTSAQLNQKGFQQHAWILAGRFHSDR
jgi:hypothetical protein